MLTCDGDAQTCRAFVTTAAVVYSSVPCLRIAKPVPRAEEKLCPFQPQSGVLGIAWVVVPVWRYPERWSHAPQGADIDIHFQVVQQYCRRNQQRGPLGRSTAAGAARHKLTPQVYSLQLLLGSPLPPHSGTRFRSLYFLFGQRVAQRLFPQGINTQPATATTEDFCPSPTNRRQRCLLPATAAAVAALHTST